jgi:phage I-like protein
MSEEFRSAPIKLSEEEIPKKIQILRCGNFNHDGREIKVSKEDLDNMVKNFSEKVRGIDLMIDFSHNSEGEAAGWIRSLVLSEDKNELWAEVDWTPIGLKSLEDKAFRYISADFSFAYKDNESSREFGPTLFGAGLTNRPVVKSMKPIILSEINSNQLTEDSKMANGAYEEKELQEDGMSREELEKIIKDLKDDLLKKDEELIALRNEMEEAKLDKEQKLAELKKEKELAEKNLAFDKKLSEGLVVEAQRQSFIENDMEKFLSLQSEIKMSESGSSGQGQPLTKENFEDRILKLAEERSKKENIALDVAIGIELGENEQSEKFYNALV